MKKGKKGKFQLDFQRIKEIPFFFHIYLCYIGKIFVAKLCNDFCGHFLTHFCVVIVVLVDCAYALSNGKAKIIAYRWEQFAFACMRQTCANMFEL